MTATSTARVHAARIPPHDLDTEAALVGAAILSRPSIIEALDAHVGPDDFYKPAHSTIWRGILDLFADDQPIDPTTLAAHLRHQGKLDTVGGRNALVELATSTPAGAHAAAYAKTVHRAAGERKLLKLASDLEAAVYAGEPTLTIIEALQHPTTTETHGWAAFDLVPILSSDLRPPEPLMLARKDDRHLLYPGRIHAINGESESLKSWLALHATAQEISVGHDVLYLDFEDTPESIVSRLLGLGVNPDELVAHLIYIRPDQPLDLASGQHLERLITTRQPSLAVIDGVTEAMSLEGLNLLDNSEIATWLGRLPRRIKALGPGVIMIDHVPKSGENRARGGIGGQHKLAGIDVSYLVEPLQALAHVAEGNSDPIVGRSRITVEKDRPGGVRAFAANRKHVGELEITAYPDGGVTAHIVPAVEQAEGGFRPTLLMERISHVVEKAAAPLSKSAIRGAVKGKHEAKDLALELLVAEGYIVTESGPRGSTLNRLVRPYRAKNDTPDDEEDGQDELL